MTEAKIGRKSPSKKKILLAVICTVCVAAVLAAAVYGFWHFSPAQKLLRALEAGDLPQMQQLYAQMDQTPEGFPEGVCGKLEALSSDYIQGTMEYAAVDQALKIYETMQVPGTSDALARCRSSVEQIKVSRQAYVSGQSLEAAQDYPAAMESYAQVTEEDLWAYPKAQQKIQDCRKAYRNRILTQAESLADTEAFADAMAKIREGLDVLAGDKTLLEQLERYIQADADKQRRDLLNAAAQFAEAGDYPGAIALLEQKEDDEQLHAALEVYRKEYVDVTLSAAQEAFDAEGYEAAVQTIDGCLLTLPENERLLQMKAWYESYRPEYLSVFPVTVSEGSKLYTNQHTQDQWGNTYSTAIAASKGSLTFRTDGKYALLTGTVACPYGYENDKYRIGASVEIYADGSLLYKSSLVEVDSLAQQFSLNISGARLITITWLCEGPNIWDNWGDRATIFDGAFYHHTDGNE